MRGMTSHSQKWAWPAAVAAGFALGFVSAWWARSASAERGTNWPTDDGAPKGQFGSAAANDAESLLRVTSIGRGAGSSRPGAAEQDAGVPAEPSSDQTVQRADRLVEMLNHRVRTFLPPDENPDGVEGVANATDEYLHGWADALEVGAPALIPGTAREIDRQLCDADLSDAQAVVYLRLALRMAPPRGPSLEHGLRCVLRRRTQEDIVLWTALDAWSKSNLGAAPEWSAWAERAVDPRTIRRFAPWSHRGEGRE